MNDAKLLTGRYMYLYTHPVNGVNLLSNVGMILSPSPHFNKRVMQNFVVSRLELIRIFIKGKKLLAVDKDHARHGVVGCTS